MQNFGVFLYRLLLVLSVFSIGAYWTTHSIWTTFVATLVCAVLLQIGYFCAILLLVRFGAKEKPILDHPTKPHSLRVIEGGAPVSLDDASFGPDRHGRGGYPHIYDEAISSSSHLTPSTKREPKE